jgi:bZIP-type transcription factor MBZ1
MSKSMSTSPAASQPGTIDPLESLLDFSDYDNVQTFSPSLSPETTKGPFAARPTTTASTPASLLSSQPVMSGPSHQYDQYKQQTGIVPGALANTFAVNQNNSQISGYNGFSLDYLGINSSEDMFDFNASQSTPDMDIDFDESPAAEAGFSFFESTVNPTAIESQSMPSPSPVQTSNVGRLWPGMHQQAALAKAQAQQRQQQQIIQQQQQRQTAPKPAARPAKGPQASDPIVEQKITQLLNSMRAKSASDDDDLDGSAHVNLPRLKKDEEDMDEDERLLASEEGKKLSSKERRQLRNKVSARAFRSRRKEYITQLEAEISNKVNENGDLKAHNRALVEENKRLTDLTRMLLSSPSFSDFLDRLSSNPTAVPQTQPAPQPEQRQEARQARKDVNPYTAQQQLQQQQIGMAMIPEQTMDFSMLSLDADNTFSYQPQVFAVLETPEVPVIDTSILSGKSSNFVGPAFDSEEEKVEMPVIKRPANKAEKTETATPAAADEEFDNDPLFALYHDAPTAEAPAEPRELNTEAMSDVDIFGGIEPEKALARYELVDASEEEIKEMEDSIVMARIQRISANLDAISARLDMLSLDS